MPANGFLVLLYKHLVQTFNKDEDLRSLDWLFYNAGAKIFVHGHERTVADPKVIAEITSDPTRKWICLEMKDNGTITDRTLLEKLFKPGPLTPKSNFPKENHMSRELIENLSNTFKKYPGVFNHRLQSRC